MQLTRERKCAIIKLRVTAAMVVTSALLGVIGQTADADDYMVQNLYGSDANNGYSPYELSEATLLVGDGNDLKAADGSAASTIKNAEAEYFFGIAS